MFDGWLKLRDRCPACGLRFLENPGDPWVFLLLVDRGAFLFPLVAALFLGLHRVNLPLFLCFAGVVAAALVLTTPHRYGACVAIDYWTRVKWGDLAGRGDD